MLTPVILVNDFMMASNHCISEGLCYAWGVTIVTKPVSCVVKLQFVSFVMTSKTTNLLFEIPSVFVVTKCTYYVLHRV